MEGSIMGTFIKKEGEGSFFEHDKKGNEKAPDWSGSILLDGKLRKFALWFRQAKDSGKRYFFVKEEKAYVPPSEFKQRDNHDRDPADRFAHMPPQREEEEEPPPWE
jgi:hypothetical protein